MINDMLVSFNDIQCYLKIVSASMVHWGNLEEVNLVWQSDWLSFRTCEKKFFGTKVTVFRSITEVSAINKLGVTVSVGIFVHVFIVFFFVFSMRVSALGI